MKTFILILALTQGGGQPGVATTVVPGFALMSDCVLAGQAAANRFTHEPDKIKSWTHAEFVCVEQTKP